MVSLKCMHSHAYSDIIHLGKIMDRAGNYSSRGYFLW